MKKPNPILLRFLSNSCSIRFASTEARLSNVEITNKRNSLFSEEKKRQQALITRVEKIKVKYHGIPEPCTMIMNKHISTPYDCARHLTENIMKTSAIAYVNGQPYDMHSPLTQECDLEFANFKDKNANYLKMVNKVFWRTCSFLLGYTAERCFKDKFSVQLHSWPPPSIKSGSFVYDVQLNVDNWDPSHQELNLLNVYVGRLALQNLPFERLEVDASYAKKIFEDNNFKFNQVDEVASQTADGHSVILYRVGDHVDMSRGPMLANSSMISNFNVTSVHPLETPVGLIYRFQGVALPSIFTVSPFALNVMKSRAAKLNTTGLPDESNVSLEEAQEKLTQETEQEHTEEPDDKQRKQATSA